MASVANKLSQLKTENESLRTQVQVAQANAKSYALKSADLVLRVVKAENAVKEAGRKAKAAEECAGVAERMSKDAEERTGKITELERQLADMQLKLANAKNRAEEAESKIDVAEHKASTAERKISAAERRATAAQRKTQEVKTTLKEVEGRAQKAERKVHLAEGRTRTAEYRAEEAKCKAEEAQRNLEAAVTRATEADKEAEEAERKAQEAESRAAAAERKAEKKAEKLAAAYRRASEAETRAEAAENKAKYAERLRKVAVRKERMLMDNVKASDHELEHLAHRTIDAEVCALRAECVAAEAEERAERQATTATLDTDALNTAVRDAASAAERMETLKRDLEHANHRAQDAEIWAIRTESLAAENDEKAETFREQREKMKRENTQLKRRATKAENKAREALRRAAEAEEKVNLAVELAGQELALRPVSPSESSSGEDAEIYELPQLRERPSLFDHRTSHVSDTPDESSALFDNFASEEPSAPPEPASPSTPSTPRAPTWIRSHQAYPLAPLPRAPAQASSEDWQRLFTLHAEVQAILGPLHREAEQHAEAEHPQAASWTKHVEMFYGLCAMSAAKMWSLERRGRLMDKDATEEARRQFEWVRRKADELQEQIGESTL